MYDETMRNLKMKNLLHGGIEFYEPVTRIDFYNSEYDLCGSIQEEDNPKRYTVIIDGIDLDTFSTLEEAKIRIANYIIDYAEAAE